MAPHLEYTICFCLSGDRVLMLRRRSEPWAGLWNGLGGKIEPGENPLESVRREVLEEAGLDVLSAAHLRLGGLVTWSSLGEPEFEEGGMYAFIAELGPDGVPWHGDREGPEGMMRWQPLRWVCDLSNAEVVGSVSRILPRMLATRIPAEYRCTYVGRRLIGVSVRRFGSPRALATA